MCQKRLRLSLEVHECKPLGAGAGASDDFTFAAAHGITSDVPRLSDLADEVGRCRLNPG